MKRMIKSSYAADNADVTRNERFEFTIPKNHHRYVFSGDVDYKHGFIWGQVTRIAPYDDAEYYWAKIGDGGTNFVKFIQDRTIKDRMQYWYYDEEDYEDVNEYLNDVLFDLCKELDKLNDKVEPRIIHN